MRHRWEFGLLFAATLFMLVHGTFTYRENHQKMFARSVEIRINIPGITALAADDVLTLQGTATIEQKAYAEKIASAFMRRFANRAVNPPTSLVSNIQIREPEPLVSQRLADRSAKKRPGRGG